MGTIKANILKTNRKTRKSMIARRDTKMRSDEKYFYFQVFWKNIFHSFFQSIKLFFVITIVEFFFVCHDSPNEPAHRPSATASKNEPFDSQFSL